MKDRIKIYWYSESGQYIFKIFLYNEFLIVSGTRKIIKGGNKKKSRDISISNMFMASYLYNSTGKPIKKPDLDIWDKYLNWFQISKRTLFKWIKKRFDGYDDRLLKELEIKENE